MRQASLQLKMRIKAAKGISTPNIIGNDIERVLFKIIVWSFVAVALWYVLLLGNMVSDIVERRALEASARSLSNEVGELELTYLSISNSIDLAFSHSMGFKETKAQFTTRKSLGSTKLVKNEI